MASRLSLVLCGFLALFILAGTVVVTVTATADVAEAARFGGGKSFGGKSFMKRPAAQPSTSMNKPQASQQTPGAAAAAPAARSGLFGGMGGMLGGLLAGSLIGSMLFGGGMGGMGGGFMDILIFGGLLYLLFKFLARRKAASAAAGMAGNATAHSADNAPGSNHAYQQTGTTPGGMSWERLAGGLGGSPAADEPAVQAPSAVKVPADFNQQEFLEGAKAAYTRLNTAWDKRDLQDITLFATPAFMEEIREQAQADPTPSSTEIMLVNAELVEVVKEGDEQMASVFFNVLLRESADQSAPKDVREMWHFVRNADGTGMWRVDGIQQVS